MQQYKIEPNITIYNIFIYIYAKNAKYEESIAIFDKIIQKKLKINQITVSTLIDGIGFSKDSKKLLSKIQQIQTFYILYKRLMDFDENNYNSILEAFFKCS